MLLGDLSGAFVCYDWKRRRVVHQQLELRHVAKGIHQGCGLRVAIDRTIFDGMDLVARRKIASAGVKRWYERSETPEERSFRIGALHEVPDQDAYLKELRARLYAE